MNILCKATSDSDRQSAAKSVSDDVCQVLSGILGDGVDIHRCLAAQALGRIGAEAAVDPLIEALLDEDEDVRTDAAEALSRLADPRSAKQLLENLLGDPCAEVKLAAIETLVKLQDRQVIPWLRRMLKGRDAEIVWDEEEYYQSAWDDWVDIQVKALGALVSLNVSEAVPDIVAAIGEEEAQDTTEAAFKGLAQMGKPGIAALSDYLDAGQTRLRRRAAAALAGSDAEEAAEPLAHALTDPAPEVRLAAMTALAARAPGDNRLAARFEHADATVRAEAVRLFGADHQDRLADMLDDGSVAVQVAVLTALRGFAADEARLEKVRAKLADGPAEVIAAAAKTLGAIAPDTAADDLIPLLADAERSLKIRLGALYGLARAKGECVVPAIVEAAGDSLRALRLEAMSVLSRLARADAAWPNPAGDALLSALSREAPEPAAPAPGPQDEEAVDEAVDEAGDEADDEAGDSFPTSTIESMMNEVSDPPQLEALKLPDVGIELTPVDMERLALARRIKGKKRVSLEPKVELHADIRRFASRVLGDLNQADVALALAAVLSDGDKDVRMAAAASLARIGEHLSPLPVAVSDALIAATATADRDLKLLLIRALAASEDENIVDELRGHLDDDDSFVRAEAVQSLIRLNQFGPEIEALLDDPDPAVRLHVAEGIASAGGKDAVGLLVDFSFSFDGYHGRQTARLLRHMNAAEASARFIDVLHDAERKRIWSVAIEALAELNLITT